MVCINPRPLNEVMDNQTFNTFYKWRRNALGKIDIEKQMIPCRNCIPCKIERAKEWALRCSLELPYWDKAIFTTLTYRDEDLPADKSLHKEVLNKFVDNLRNHTRDRQIKIMGCGEYGDNSFRCHYHLIIFGIGLDFNKPIQYGKDKTYMSENGVIEKCWQYGNVFNGAVTYNSSRYVASYIFKKYNGTMEKEIYKDNGFETPFQKISNGIGKQFYEDYKIKIFNDGYILFNGIKHSLPRYYYKLAEKENLWEQLGTNKTMKTHEVAKNIYEKAYEKIQSELAKKLLITPDKFNASYIGDYENLQETIYREWKEEKEKSDLAKAKHLTHKDGIYNGETNL